MTDVSASTPDPAALSSSAPAPDPDDEGRTPFREWPAAGRWVVYVAVGLVLALAAGTVATAAMVRRSFPDTDGTVTPGGLQSAADVRRDRLGVPHVEASAPHDLFFAQGYAQAQDRFFAMDVARHRAAGRLAELLGPAAVSSDLVARTLGWHRLADAELADLEPATQENLRAFSEGVNAYLRSNGPSTLALEYTLLELAGLNYKPERWSPVDSLAILKAEGSWRPDVTGEVDRARLGLDRSPSQVDELYPASAPAEGTADAFVVGGALTASGKPLLADALVGSPSLPSRWMQVSLRCNPVTTSCPYDVTGATLPGVPGVLAGHNGTTAWGLARSAADVADLFLAELDGKRYLHGRRWEPLALRDETIRIQGEPSRTFTVRATADGPLLSDVSGEVSSVGANAVVPTGSPERGNGYAVALASTALAPSRAADALFALGRSTGATDVRDAASRLALPGFDLVYADANGEAGKVTLGPLPTRSPGRTGRDATPGWRNGGHWLNRIAALPATTDLVDGVLGGGARVRAMVGDAPAGGWTAAALSAVQADTRNPIAPVLVPYLLTIPQLSRYYADGQRLLTDWDFRQPAGSAAAAYFNVVWSNLLRLTFGDDLRASLQPDGGPRWQAVVRQLLRQPNSPWWDDAHTEDVVEDRDTILAQAMRDARDELTRTLARDPKSWHWGDLHRMSLRDGPLRPRDLGLLWKLVDRGSSGVGGGTGSVAGTTMDLAEGYEVVRAPLLRLVVDLGDPDASRWVVAGGTSGHAFADHHRDQLATWRRGDAYPWPFSKIPAGDVLRLRRGD
ncbi:MAG: penicillin acylase family protein [Nocardioidaceae bacterium]|nr:penicillin acylase family protein [Nocardioidaceae bacterium]